MTIDSQGRKISNFPALSSIPDGAILSFVSGSTNYKITKANFLAALGVTGTLVADGSITAIAVLEASGSVYTIRGLEDGAGIVCGVSPSNGIKIANNFTQESSFTALIDSFSNTSPKFASLKAGTGISVSKANDIITISATGETPHAIITMSGNTTATTIGSAGTAVLAGGNWVSGEIDNFTASTAGRLTYTGNQTANITVDASITFKRAVGSGEIDVAAVLYKNGSAASASKRVTSCSNSASGAVSMPYIIEMAQNDYLELYVSNEETSDNITVTDAMFRVATGVAAGTANTLTEAEILALFASPPATGIGNVTPRPVAATTLSATGTTSLATTTFSSGTGTQLSLSGDLTVDTTTLKVDSTNNRVGIGTASPSSLLHLRSSDQSTLRLRFDNTGPGRVWEIVGGLAGADNTSFSIYDVTGTTTRYSISSGGAHAVTGTLTGSSTIKAGGFTVGTLPTGVQGARTFVTDSNAASITAGIGAIVAAGGTTVAPVMYDGTNWRIV